jgi:hypothetical protein
MRDRHDDIRNLGSRFAGVVNREIAGTSPDNIQRTVN